MCGIAGVYLPRGAADPDRVAAVVGRMTDALAHRGPDGSGLEAARSGPEGPAVVFGHRRLAVLDPAHGGQPAWSADRRALMTYNGEVFDYRELRALLAADGATFRGTGDTEVVPELFLRYGDEGFSLMNGQFAIGLFDVARGELHLVRDRAGEKPLYYAALPCGTVAFGSELKALVVWLREGGPGVRVDEAALVRFLSLNYVPYGETLVSGVRSVPAGGHLVFSPSGVRAHTLSPLPGATEEGEGACRVPPDDLGEVLRDAVRLRLRSDAPLGVFLSGGVDSTLVASYAAEAAGGPRTAFVADFAEAGFSEAASGADAARRLGLDPVIVPIDPGPRLPALLPELAWHLDAPLADSSAVPFYLLSEAAARSVTVVLSGDGGDECFGGYLTYRATMLARRMPRPLRRAAGAAGGLLFDYPSAGKVGFKEKAARFARYLTLPPGAAHFGWNGCWTTREREGLLRPELRGIHPDTFIAYAGALGVDPGRPAYRSLLSADRRGYLVDDILAKGDRASMAHGLEVRAPLLDPRVVAYAAACREEEVRRKAALRDLLYARCPWYPRRRPKQGFSVPVHRWLRTHLAQYAADEFRSAWFEGQPYLDPGAVRRVWEDHRVGRRDRGFELWGILVLCSWLRRFAAGPRS